MAFLIYTYVSRKYQSFAAKNKNNLWHHYRQKLGSVTMKNSEAPLQVRPTFGAKLKWVETLRPNCIFTFYWPSKGGYVALPPPSPPCNVVLPIGNNNWGDRGGVRVLLLSEVTQVEYNFSTILSPIVAYLNSNLNLLLLKTCQVPHLIFFNVLIYEALSLKREYTCIL